MGALECMRTIATSLRLEVEAPIPASPRRQGSKRFGTVTLGYKKWRTTLARLD
jgi:hypothetical protein